MQNNNPSNTPAENKMGVQPVGRLLAGMDNGLNFLFDDVGTLPLTVSNPLPFNPHDDLHAGPGPVQCGRQHFRLPAQ